MSIYYKSLSTTDKLRYEEKLNFLGFSLDDDPYIISKLWKDDVTQWPDLQYGDLYTYLIDTPGPYTRTSLRSFRSLEAYSLFESGWVQTTFIRHNAAKTKCILKAKVHRSQSVNEKPHEGWVGLDVCGKVECAHCTCMAGLGEVCSHVAGILFKIEACVRLEFNKVACTSMPCAWNQNFTQKVQPALVDDICFSKAKKDQLVAPLPAIPEATFADTSSLRFKLRKSVPNAVLFSITHPVITDWTQIQNEILPSPLTVLYNENNKSLSEESLQMMCKNVFADELKVTADEVAALEKATVGQSKSSTWFEHRVGRLTASNFGNIFHCRCKPDQISLLAKIMQYHEATGSQTNYCQTGSSVPCEWGLKHEKDALSQYQDRMMSSHFNLALSSSGLVVNQDFPHLGATPDSYVSCDCCGRGLVEVKCLYKHKDEHPCKLADQQFFLNPHTVSNPLCSNALKLSHNHYYQIQGQLHVCNLEFCDFVVWSSKGLHVERIFKNKTIWDSLKVKLDFYFLQVVLPELLTRKNDPKLEHACPTPRRKRPRKV